MGWKRKPGAREVASAAAGGGAEEEEEEGWVMRVPAARVVEEEIGLGKVLGEGEVYSSGKKGREWLGL